MKLAHVQLWGATGVALLPTVAHAQMLTPVTVFFDADIIVKLIMLGLLGATVAAAVIGAAKLAAADRLTGGSAFLSALRLGGPLLGVLGAAYTGVIFWVAVSNLNSPPDLTVLAPGIAEMVLVVFLGLLAGVVATAFHGLIEARIDRTVLKS